MEFREIIDAMEQAESYDEMYTLADEIVNPNLHADVVDMIDICKRDGDDLETCWSLVSTVHLDDKIYLNNDEDLTEMEDEELENLDEAKQKTTEKLNTFEKTTFSKKVLDAQTDNELKDIIGEIRYYSEPTYTRCMEIIDGEGTTQYKAGQISDIIYQLNETKKVKTEKVLTSSNGKFKKGDVYINGQGAMIRITDYTKAGTPQFDIGMPVDFTRGTYECRGTDSDESLQSILDNNGYVKVNESKQIKAEEASVEFKVGDVVKVPYKYGSYTPGEFTEAPIIDITDNHFVTLEIPSKLEVTVDQLRKWNSKQIKTEEVDRTYINNNLELKKQMDTIYKDLESRLNSKLGITLQGDAFGRFDEQYKTAIINVDDTVSVKIRLAYSLPDGIYNYIRLNYSGDKITQTGSGQIEGTDLQYSESSTMEEIPGGSYSAYKDDSPTKIERKGLTVDEFIANVKHIVDEKIDSKTESSEEQEVKEYRYITNHGIGPGTLPSGVFVRAEVLPNFKTAIYTNRPLTDEELKYYDIKPEWIQECKIQESKDIQYITQEELDAMDDDYKTTVGHTIDVEVNYWGKNREDVVNYYKNLGFSEQDPMIITMEDGQTVLKPVKIKQVESKLTEGTESWKDVQENDIKLYMNTWKNYNENGAEAESIGGGWMNIDEAEEFYKSHGEEEPFINDIDWETTFTPCVCKDVTDDTDVLNFIEDVRTYCRCQDQEILQAIMESDSCNVDEAMDILNSGSYVYYSGVSDDEELGQQVVSDAGGLLSALTLDTIRQYIDEDLVRDDLRQDEMFQDYVLQEEDANSIDDVDDDTIDEYLDEYVDMYITDMYNGGNEEGLETYFDFEDYGSDISMDYTFTEFGAVSI